MGITDPDFVPHALRHTRAMRLFVLGNGADAVQACMGHSDITTTMRYVHFDTTRFSEVSAKADAHKALYNQLK
jgi:integrase